MSKKGALDILSAPVISLEKTKNPVNITLFTDKDKSPLSSFTDEQLKQIQEKVINATINSYQKSISTKPFEASSGAAASGSYQSTVISGSGYTTGIGSGSGTSWTPGVTYYPTTPPAPGPSWDELMKKIVEDAVAAATKEMTETLKDIQEQIDEIWESLGEDE